MKRWKQNLWILWITQVISLASFGFGLPFIPLYIQELEVLTPEKLKILTTVLAAAPAITMAIMAPIWGYLADKYGRKLMIIRAMTFAIFIIGAMGLVQNISQLIILRVLQGLLTGTVTAAIAFVSSNTPRKHLIYALGVISSSTFIGFSIGPVLGGFFAETYGYRMSFILGGGLMLIGVLLVLFLIKEDKSTLMPKHSIESETFFERYKSILIPTIIIIMSLMFLLRIVRTLFSPYLSLFIQSAFDTNEGVAKTTGIVSAAAGIATGVASIFISKIALKINKFKLIIMLFSGGVFISVLLTQYNLINDLLFDPGKMNSIWIFLVLYTLFFFILGGIEPLLTSTAAMNVDPSKKGALFGFQGFVGSIAWFASPVIAGPIVYKFSLTSVLYVIPIVLLISIIFSVKLKKLKLEI